jgi:hypothetical protein
MLKQHVPQIGVHYPIADFRLLRPSKKRGLTPRYAAHYETLFDDFSRG